MTTVTVSGVFVDGINYSGGEGTGWELQTDDLGSIEVDVEQVMAQALMFRQQFVAITGYYTSETRRSLLFCSSGLCCCWH